MRDWEVLLILLVGETDLFTSGRVAEEGFFFAANAWEGDSKNVVEIKTAAASQSTPLGCATKLLMGANNFMRLV